MRRPARAVSLEDIISARILGDEEGPGLVSLMIRIHLACEALLIELHRTKSADDAFLRLSWPRKTSRLVRMGVIEEADRRALNRFNDFRNDFAHVYGHRVDLVDVARLVRYLAGDGIDFDDVFGDYSDIDVELLYGYPYRAVEAVGYGLLSHVAILLYVAGGRDILGVDDDEGE